ncbi:unnamed protein product [Somion occarium]|uniref:DASH complex subunit DAD2 n=1 Tax=Somion occarium TaxID=3059160 RepID=A0ABP1DLD1_9APHY
MRQSMASSRQSHAPPQAPSAPAQAKLLEKKKECEAVIALERASANFVRRIEALGDDFDVIADAGTVHGQVLEQWPNMFRILDLFLSTRQQNTEREEQRSTASSGERLVRIPIEDLQASTEKDSS